MAALRKTYGVGELSAICGVGGSYAENLPIVHLVGMPAKRTPMTHRIVHHTLGNREFELLYKMAEPVVCARAIITPENYATETERVQLAHYFHTFFVRFLSNLLFNCGAQSVGACNYRFCRGLRASAPTTSNGGSGHSDQTGGNDSGPTSRTPTGTSWWSAATN